ncbi:glycoside hydrolase domain-containing protein [Gramella sp. AN32]|uniref:Glycoside hydrolase domain-containing protein n=1 Tax=Christiangramia antarctica TaxID=2058158 RepID=A0ABW5X2S3_9FLAO|nr:glycoside hydrolase domain-containing protein [Gramella sp. AN32]MCM4157029.1 hypothetical protein [Gramella sp. AN32]
MHSKNIQFALFVISLLCVTEKGTAQLPEGITHSGLKTGQPQFPMETYMELPNPTATPSALWEQKKRNKVSWGNTYTRYKKEEPAPVDKTKSLINLSAWKGERVSAQFIVSAYKKPIQLSFEVSDLVHHKNSSQKIDKSNIFSGFVRYVMTDELNKDGKGGCGQRNLTEFDSTLVADPIDHLTKVLAVPQNTSRPGWIRIWVPQNTKAGKYTGTVKIKDGNNVIEKLKLSVSVSDRILPAPENWNFHLDLWQNPYAAARYYQTELWSDAHFKTMEHDIQHYVNAGGKSITASIMNKPWNGQTQDPFQSMITWKRKINGSWEFGFDAFDKWVEFMMEMGVTKQINCYSMVPWRLSFEYFDEASNEMKTIETQPGEEAYAEMWGAMLTAFSEHLKKKGWFKKTYISMDERPMEVMQKTIKVIKAADKDFKISFAGGKHPEIFNEIDDYCLSLNESFPEEVKEKRQQEGKISTFYTSCSQASPNSFTFSPPAETEWYGWYAAAQNMDGYLRWAYASWVLEPLLDSRFTTWAAGDTYFVYPGGRTSIRFEKLLAGIQAYEKIQILREEFRSSNNQKALDKLEESLQLFDRKNLNDIPASEVVKKANMTINSF